MLKTKLNWEIKEIYFSCEENFGNSQNIISVETNIACWRDSVYGVDIQKRLF